MAPSHVPNDSIPMQANLYANPNYEHDLFARGDRYVAHGGAVPWDQFNQNHVATSQAQPSGARSWHHGSALPQQSFNTMSQPYANQAPQYQTASPYQYAQYHNGHLHGHASGPGPGPGPANPPTHFSQPQPTVDPLHGNAVDAHVLRQQQQSPYQHLRTPAPQAQVKASQQPPVQHHQNGGAPLTTNRPAPSPYQTPKPTPEIYIQRPAPVPVSVQPVTIPNYDIPQGKFTGGFSIIDPAGLAAATNSSVLNKLVNLGKTPLHLPTNRTALPVYNARQSVKELKKAGTNTKRLLEGLAKKSSSNRAKFNSRTSATKSSSLKREVSDSESYSDSSDDSEYTDDEEDEPSPLPAVRPDEPHAAVRYDVIKATWQPRMSHLDTPKLRKMIGDFLEVTDTIKKRWRDDCKAVTAAEGQKKTGELPVLKSRAASQRDLFESAMKTALEFAHHDLFYNLGRALKFLYLCYLFLANRIKVQDYDGSLTTVIYQVLARCAGGMTTELLDESKVMRAMVQTRKHANEATKALVQQCLDGAAAGSKRQAEQKATTPPEPEVTDPKTVKRPAPAGPTPARPLTDSAPAAAPAAAAKKVNAPISATLPVKKAPTVAPMSKPGAPNGAAHRRVGDKPAVVPVRAKATQMVNKPTNVFSSLNAASKKAPAPSVPSATSKASAQQKAAAPAAKDKKLVPPVSRSINSFAQTMASLVAKEEPAAPTKSEKKLPPETPEQKEKRLRKEARRHLRVTFRPDASLVEIKYFSHDPDEEQGHDANFVRDAGDIGGEGRMFKQHIDMNEEEDDDESDMDHRPWIEPDLVDFTSVPAEERQRNYIPYGGGEQIPVSPEKEASQRRENSTLLVFYTDPSDIPPSPREPAESSNEASKPALEFGAPAQRLLDRMPALPSTVDLQKLLSQIQPALSTQTPAAAPPPSTAPAPDLQAILQGLPANPSMLANFPPPPLPSAVSAPPFDPSTFGALLAQINISTGGVPGTIPQDLPNMPSLPNLPNFQDPAALRQLLAGAVQPEQPAQQQQSQHNQQYDYNSHYDHHQSTNNGKRAREDGNHHNDRGYGSFKKSKNGNYNKYDRPQSERPHLHKTIPCKFWNKGNCTKGNDCTFIHDRSENHNSNSW